jgi:hypothetical protein
MFITDQLTPAETLSELVSLKGYSKADTERFRKLRHNDHLCPGFRERIAVMLEAYKSHRTDVHDIQGARDEGVDVLLRYTLDGEHRIGLQIKSFDEIEAWRTKRDREFVQRLKAQQATGVHNLRVEDYYLLLCTDEIEHKDQIRLICSELKQFAGLKIILPRQALAFYELADVEVQAHVTRLLCRDDSVLEAAVKSVRDMPPDRAFLTIALVCRAFEGQLRLSQKEVFDLYADWQGVDPKSGPEGDRLANLVWELDGAGLTADGDGFVIEIPQLSTALCAIYFDLKERRSGDMVLGLAAMLGVTPVRPQRRKPRRA